MRHILTKFILAVLIFVSIVWWGVKQQQERIAHLADDAAALAQTAQ